MVMVEREEAGSQAPFKTGIAVHENRFIPGDFVQAPGQFTDIDMVGPANIADGIPVSDVPNIKQERGCCLNPVF